MPLAVRVHAFGAPETFVLEPFDPGPPPPGHVRLRVHAIGLSYVDALVASGGYQLKPPLPFVPGSEVAGVIEGTGEGVPASRIGERVFAFHFGGGLSELANIPSGWAQTIPEELSTEAAAAFPLNYRTVYHALVQRGALRPGETVLVLGASGAVGQAAVQLAKALGGKVIAAASTEEKRALAIASGAEHAIDSRSPTFRDDLRAITSGIDVVVDPVGGALLEPAFRSLRWGGRHLVIGFVGGAVPKLPVNLALLKGAALVGVDVRQFGEREPELALANMSALVALLRDGHPLRPTIARSYPLEEFAAALTAAGSGELAGRAVVTTAAGRADAHLQTRARQSPRS